MVARVVPVTITGFTSLPFPPTLADGSPNDPATPQVSAGQIAVWLTEAEVQAAIRTRGRSGTTDARFNAITAQDETVVITAVSDIVEIAGNGTSGPTTLGLITNNDTPVTFGAVPSGGEPAFRTNHDIKFLPGPLQLVDVTFAAGHEQVSHDGDSPVNGGIGELPGSSRDSHGTIDGTDHTGQVARGQVRPSSSRSYAAEQPGAGVNLAFSQCVAFDTAHYELTSLRASITVREAFAPSNGGTISTTGYSSTAPSKVWPVATGNTSTHVIYRPWLDGFGGELRWWSWRSRMLRCRPMGVRGRPVSTMTD